MFGESEHTDHEKTITPLCERKRIEKRSGGESKVSAGKKLFHSCRNFHKGNSG